MTIIKSNQCTNASQTGTNEIKSLHLKTLNSFTISSSNNELELEDSSGGGVQQFCSQKHMLNTV